MNAPVQIRKADTVERLRRLAALEGKTITELVDEMVRERDRRFEAERIADIDRRRKAVEEAVRRFNALPIVGPMLTDDDFYDEFGLPK
ncbi:MAG: type II toxin-antitoxin system VapB family antitoxin [Brevundimonas sp.]